MGWAAYNMHSGTITSAQQTLGQRPHLEVSHALYDAHIRHTINTIILEPFLFRKEDSRTRAYIDYTPAEYVGVVKEFAQEYNVPLVLQQASQAVGETAFWGDGALGNKKMQDLGIWVPGKQNPHQRDALRHLLYYLSFTLKNKSFFELLRTGKKYDRLDLNVRNVTQL